MNIILNHKIAFLVVNEDYKNDYNVWRITYNINDNPHLSNYFMNDIINGIPIHCKEDTSLEYDIIIKNISLCSVSHMDDVDEAYIDPNLYGDIAECCESKEERQHFLKNQVYGKIVFQKV